jgi:hypothetical protein
MIHAARSLLVQVREHARAAAPASAGGQTGRRWQPVAAARAASRTGNDLVAGDLTPKEPEREMGAHHRDRLEHTLQQLQAPARQHVIRQDRAGPARGHAQREQGHPDQPGQPARPAERAGEEQPQQMQGHRRDEDQRGPVVDLAHQQAAAHVEAEVEGRFVRLADRHTAQRAVQTVIGDPLHGRVEEHGQVDARGGQHHEGIQRDLPEQQRPVICPCVPRPPRRHGARQP